jgi:ferredoxin
MLLVEIFILLVLISTASSLRGLPKWLSEIRSTRRGALQKTDIDFQPANKRVFADVGSRFQDVAKAEAIEIQYKCKKGECGTCEIKVDGKWTKACQLTIPALPKGDILRVSIPPVKEKVVSKAPAKFFSPASFVEGVVNNGLGVRHFTL